MKWTAVTINLSKVRKTAQHVGVISRTFGTLALATVLFFMLLGAAGYVQSKNAGAVSPVSSMKGFAASVSSRFFLDMIAMEIPHLKEKGTSSAFSQKNVLSFMFRYLTDVNTQDPKTLVAREVPGMSNDRTTLLRTGVATASDDAPMDNYDPPVANGGGDTKGNAANGAGAGTDGGGAQGKAQDPNPSDGKQPPAGADPAPGSKPAPDSNGTANPKPAPDAKPPSAGRNVAFIYHSHNQESFLPELPGVKDPDRAYDASKNITLVGERLAESLEKDGVGAVHSDVNYPAEVKNFNYAYSYKYSLKTLQEAFAAHKDLKYFFDIHRDSQVRGKTTTTINGVDYAQVYFILGEKNPHWKENEQFAAKIHEALEAKHPGISKGIHAKSSSEGNGEYNQSFSPNSVLIEVGGPYNTLEECYRTADLLAEAIAEVVLNAQKVNASAESAPNAG